jgi:hypothetical protein
MPPGVPGVPSVPGVPGVPGVPMFPGFIMQQGKGIYLFYNIIFLFI